MRDLMAIDHSWVNMKGHTTCLITQRSSGILSYHFYEQPRMRICLNQQLGDTTSQNGDFMGYTRDSMQHDGSNRHFICNSGDILGRFHQCIKTKSLFLHDEYLLVKKMRCQLRNFGNVQRKIMIHHWI